MLHGIDFSPNNVALKSVPYNITFIRNIYRTRKRSLPRYQNTEKCVEQRGRSPSFFNNFEVFWDRGKELFRGSLYNFSNESVFKEKIEVNVVLIYGSSLPRYQDTIRLWFSFVFSSWINNDLRKYMCWSFIHAPSIHSFAHPFTCINSFAQSSVHSHIIHSRVHPEQGCRTCFQHPLKNVTQLIYLRTYFSTYFSLQCHVNFSYIINIYLRKNVFTAFGSRKKVLQFVFYLRNYRV